MKDPKQRNRVTFPSTGFSLCQALALKDGFKSVGEWLVNNALLNVVKKPAISDLEEYHKKTIGNYLRRFEVESDFYPHKEKTKK